MSDTPSIASTDTAPAITVVIAAFNVAEFLSDALASVQRQTLEDLEIIVVDDGSTDGTYDIAVALAQSDARIKVLKGPGRGPAAARNLAIRAATGEWIAVVDGDDHISPDRFERLSHEAASANADAVADNLYAFYDDAPDRNHVWVAPDFWEGSRFLSFSDLMEGGLPNSGLPELGYLKPMMRRDRLMSLDELYREDLMIGEDFDLLARWTERGFTYRYISTPMYNYRRRASSLSYRITPPQLEMMISALQSLLPPISGQNRFAVEKRINELQASLRYAIRIEAIKRKDVFAVMDVLRRTDSRRRLFRSIREGLTRRLAGRRPRTRSRATALDGASHP